MSCSGTNYSWTGSSTFRCALVHLTFGLDVSGAIRCDSNLGKMYYIRNLGVWFDANFSFSGRVKMTCKACFLQMHDLRTIRQYLTPKLAVLAADALVSRRLNCCKSLFRGLSCFNQHKMQSIQNTLARIVTNHRKYAHVTPILKQLHLLPVKYWCIFKTGTLVQKFLHGGSPSYFEPFLSLGSCPYSTRRSHPDINTLQFLLSTYQS